MSRNRIASFACVGMTLFIGCGGAASKAKSTAPEPSASVAAASSSAVPTANPDALAPADAALLGEIDKAATAEAARLGAIGTQIAHSDNPILVREATKHFLVVATRVGSGDWREQQRSEVKSRSERHGVVLSDPQLEMKMVDYQNDRLIPIVDAMSNLGSSSIVDWSFHEAEDKSLSFERRKASIKLLQRLVPASDSAGAARLAPLSAEMDKLAASQDTANDSVNDVQQVIAGITVSLKKCADSALKKNPKLDVNGSLELKIGGDGVVNESHAKDVAPADLATCVEKTGKEAKFAAPKNQRSFTVRLPLVFRAVPAT